MSIAQQIGRVSSNFETATRVGEFVALARLVMLAKGDPLQAAEIARAGACPRASRRFFGNQRSRLKASRPIHLWPSTPARRRHFLRACAASARSIKCCWT
jgi:hypothetical protein